MTCAVANMQGLTIAVLFRDANTARHSHSPESVFARMSPGVLSGQERRRNAWEDMREEESMCRTTKTGEVLGAGIIMLAAVLLLTGGSARAHESTVRLSSPTCKNLPSEAGFLAAIPITATALAPQGSATRRGGGVTGRGDDKFRYARITVPALAAGELRVFGVTTDGLSDAVLCRGSGQLAKSITSYTAHNTAHAAAARADDNDDTTATDAAGRATAAAAAATAASTAADDTSTTPSLTTRLSRARSALNTARSALNTARSALNTAGRALQAANAAAANITTVTNAEQAALAAYNNPNTASPPTSQEDETELDAVQAALGNVSTALTSAASVLTSARGFLITAADAFHTGFQIRAPVSPGDQEYIVVAASQDPAADLAVNIQFHGAIDAATPAASITGALRAGGTPTYTLLISAPGLLTVETTGSTDTVGMLDGPGDVGEIAQAEAGGSGDNFKIVAPVPANTANYTLTVEGQTSTTVGDYALDMDFKVAMAGTISALPGTTALRGVTVPPAPTWTGTGVPADDTTLQIQRRAADGNVADEDYFLLTVRANSGFLTVEANDDTTSAKDSDTKGTLFGAMGEGPMMEMRTGQIATDADSGPGAHFGFTVPVEAGKYYLVKVEGTDGVYTLRGSFTAVEDPDNDAATGDTITPPVNPISTTLAASTGTTQTVDRYLLSISESGALYLHTTGKTDVTGTLRGPDGSQIASDKNSGDGNNFRIAVSVGPGLYILEVKGATRTTTGTYILVANFVTGAEVEEPTPPPDPTDPTPPTTIEPDPTGSLEEPVGIRSGIGLIRGWVCQDDGTGVEIRIRNAAGDLVETFTAPYGSARGDVENPPAGFEPLCDRRGDDFGFAVQYNYNLLPAGQYTVEAWVGREQVGQTNTFRVARISNRDFLRRLNKKVTVEDFPFTGDTTILEWDQASQNFQIIGTQ